MPDPLHLLHLEVPLPPVLPALSGGEGEKETKRWGRRERIKEIKRMGSNCEWIIGCHWNGQEAETELEPQFWKEKYGCFFF